MTRGAWSIPCPYKPGDGLYGYHILHTHTSNLSHVLICREPSGKQVVLKTPADPADHPSFSRDVRWWRAVTADEHLSTHLVRCIASRRLDGNPFAILEYVNGPSLGALLDREPRRQLAVSQALLYGIQFCLGMISASAQASSHGRRSRAFAHGDICPANILISVQAAPDDGRHILKITDFGIARPLTRRAAARGGARGFAGRPNYAAPEMLDGRHRATVVSDVYSLGVTLWEMLTGAVPHRIQTSEPFREFRWRVLRTETPAFVEQRPGVPPELAPLLERCLERVPSRRYTSFEILLGALRELAARLVGRGELPGEDARCQACGYIPPSPPDDGPCALCRGAWEPAPVGTVDA